MAPTPHSEEYKAHSPHPPTEPPMSLTPKSPSPPWTSIHDWTTLQHTLATNPDAEHLLTTYGSTAWQTLEYDLHRHPYLAHRTTFNQAYIHALWHRIINAARTEGHLANRTYKALECITGIPWGRLRDWHLHIKSPHLERTLKIHEATRQHWEQNLPTQTKAHILDPSLVYTTFQPLLDNPATHTPDTLTHAIITLYHHGNHQRLIIAELKPYHRIGPQALRTIAKSITKHHSVLETALTELLNLTATQEELRIAVDHDVLYLWRKTTHPDHWLNTYHHELLYLTPKFKENLISKAQRHLNVNNQQLGQLITQLTTHTRQRTHNPRAIPYELFSTKHSQHLYGDTLHLLLDTTHQPFNAITPHITQIGRISNTEHGGGIKNPQFPIGNRLSELRARLIAIALSDCHINRRTSVLTYHEKVQVRFNYVRNLFRELGKVDYKTEELAGKRKRLVISAVVGRLIENWGVPKGDKHLHPEYRVPDTILCGARKIKQAYLAEVIPEDGFFVNRSGIHRFGIKRAQILDAGHKTKIYNFQPKITPQHKNLIQRYGTERTQTSSHDKPRQVITLTKGQLSEIANDTHNLYDQQLAKNVELRIRENSCPLLKDEIQIAKSLDINMTLIFKELKLQETGRVSAIWEAYTKRENDTFRWAQLALPSSNPKRDSVKKWVATYH